jgi:putative glutamine amidotransferase
MNATKPIGVTQRMIVAPPHGEVRDCLAVDWYPFLKALGLPWLVLPNEVDAAQEMARRFGLGGLILTGGDDTGVFPRRDETELSLLEWAAREKRPAVGVCRGFQVIYRWLGGEVTAVDPEIHKSKRHILRMADGASREVNSYHNYAPLSLPTGLVPLAHCAVDGQVEAAVGGLLLGVMWHPERETQPDAKDVHLFLNHLTEKA